MTISFAATTSGGEDAKLPALQCPVFLVLVEPKVVSVSMPGIGMLARWQPGVAGSADPDRTITMQGKSVRMQVLVESGLASKVIFSADGHQGEVAVPAEGVSDSWGRIRPNGEFSFGQMPDYS